MSNEKFMTPLHDAGLFVCQRETLVRMLWLSHPSIINISAMAGFATYLRLNTIRFQHLSLLRFAKEITAVWLKKCLLMQRTTRKSGLQLLMATG